MEMINDIQTLAKAGGRLRKHTLQWKLKCL